MDPRNVRNVSVNNMKEKLHFKTLNAHLNQLRDTQLHAHTKEEKEMLKQLEKLQQDKVKYGLVEASASSPSARVSPVKATHSTTRQGSLPAGHLLPGQSSGAIAKSPSRQSSHYLGDASKPSLVDFKSVSSGINEDESQPSLSGQSFSKLTGSGLLVDPRRPFPSEKTPESSMTSVRKTSSISNRRRAVSSTAGSHTGERFRRLSLGGSSELHSSSRELRDGSQSFRSDSGSTASAPVGKKSSGFDSGRHSVCLMGAGTGNAADTRHRKPSPLPGEAQPYHHMFSSEALETLHNIIKESKPPTRPAPGLAVRLPPIFGPVCSVNPRYRKKLMALQLLVNHLPSVITQPPAPEFNPLEVLSCRYLRLSATNVETLTEMCRQAGIDPGIHPHMTPEQLEEEIRHLLEPPGQAASQLTLTGGGASKA